MAGQRPGIDILAQENGQTLKALIPVAGQSMLSRVVGALDLCPRISRIVVVAQDPQLLLSGDTARLLANPKVRLTPSTNGIASSIAAIAGSALAPWPVLVTTADHALLTPEMIDEFLDSCEGNAKGGDLAIAFGERRIVEGGYPRTSRTWLKFRDGHYSGANLFALRNAKVMPALTLWSGVEQQRKKGLAVISQFGPLLLLRALTRTISFRNALAKAGATLGLKAELVVMSQPEAVIDVDKPADLVLAEQILRLREKSEAACA
ncbi:nucleotidyltransferase family protein [Allopontixanthobacter sp.]|uniref:nucleotidyltransferase family protein n=1 Tax=Allopontixanthobacter sp. TaxID=2906452 RepID=UPI002AC8FCC9|nr:nucleotidyltransferase family protein [Allopontixanthobacter sp.]